MTTRAPFEPIGVQARWRTVHELLRATPIDGVLTYEKIADALDLDPAKDRSIIHQSVSRAAKEHEETDKRAIDAVRGVGYRVVEPKEHMGLALRHQKRSRKQLERGRSKVDNVDFTGMEPEVRKAFEILAGGFAMQAEFNRRIENRQARLDRALREISDVQTADRERNEQEVANLRERLARLEQGS